MPQAAKEVAPPSAPKAAEPVVPKSNTIKLILNGVGNSGLGAKTSSEEISNSEDGSEQGESSFDEQSDPKPHSKPTESSSP